MEKYVHKKTFDIKYCDVDFKDELKPSALLSYLEEVSCSSADELGFGYAYVKARNYAFIVTSYRMEFLKPITHGLAVEVCTWPTPPSHVVFGREYFMQSNIGELLCKATSRWCLIDMDTRKILPSRILTEQDYSTYNTTKLFENTRWKLPTFTPEDGELKFTITIANSECDHNIHVNNTRYADYCFNCFSMAELQAKRVKSFAINYVKECREGDTLRFYRKRSEEGEYCVCGFNGAGELVVQSRIDFEEDKAQI